MDNIFSLLEKKCKAKFNGKTGNDLKKYLEEYNMGIEKLIPSPILGGSGNKEFLMYVKRNVKSKVNIIEVCK